MKVGIPKEIYPNERRVAATPETVQKLTRQLWEFTEQVRLDTIHNQETT